MDLTANFIENFLSQINEQNHEYIQQNKDVYYLEVSNDLLLQLSD